MADAKKAKLILSYSYPIRTLLLAQYIGTMINQSYLTLILLGYYYQHDILAQ